MKELIKPPFDKQTLILRKLRAEQPAKFKEAIAQLSDEEAELLLYNDDIWLRENQIFHHYPESIVFFMGGRGTGKGHSGSRWVRRMVEEYGARNIGIIGQTNFDVKNVMVHGPSGILNAFPPKDRPEYSPANRTITFKNGAKAYAFSAQDGDKLRGNNFDLLWCDEVCTWQDEDAFNQAMLALRAGVSKALLTSSPKPTKLIIDLWKRRDTDVRFIHGTTYENLPNLSKAYREQIIAAYEGTRLGSQELDGKLLLDVPGALWKNETIARNIIDIEDVPELKKIIVGLDPSGSSKEGSDECGLIVAGQDFEGIIYILEDATEILSPHAWATKTVHLLDKWDADLVVYEKNYGAEMIEAIFRPIRKSLPLKDVWAKKAKLLRAEGPSLLYEKNQVKHVKGLQKLEEEMTKYDGRGKSPNRLDAMVYCVLELAGKKTFPAKTFEFHI